MVRQIIMLFVTGAMAGFGLVSCEKPETLGGCHFPESLDAYELVWSDEFDGGSIDAANWGYDLADGCQLGPDLCGWGNNELQYYTDRAENAYVEDGNLVIKAIRESPLYQGNWRYTSARMVTRDKYAFRYGRVDVRARLPFGQGLWPAVWMLSQDNAYGNWPKSGEIDIMESIGSEPNKVLGTIHYGHDYWRFTGEEYRLENGTFADEFHVFSVQWTEDCIQFLVDGKVYSGPYTRSSLLPTTWPFDQDFYLILNIAVGGNLPGNPGANTLFPQTMEVDYVRVYQ